jgi:hypothetical protein
MPHIPAAIYPNSRSTNLLPILRTSLIFFLFALAIFSGCTPKTKPNTSSHRAPSPANNATNAATPVSLLFKPGCEFTYTGRVEWAKGTQIFSTNLQWTMKVLDVAQTNNADIAIIRGFVSDLAWYEPTTKPQFTLLAKIENRIYRFQSENESAASAQARNILEHGVNADAEPWLDLPLAKDKRWAFDPSRADNFYCWYVQDESTQTLRVPGTDPQPNAHTWTVLYRSNPDHQIFTIANGLGIIAYEFAHHGTVATANIVLTEIHLPKN